MSDISQPLIKLPEKYAKYDKRLRECLEYLKMDLSEDESEKILCKARSEFMSILGFNLYQTYVFTEEYALEHALSIITNDRDKSRKTINACSLFRKILRNCLTTVRKRLVV